LVSLGPIDPEQDAEIESRWTQNADYLHLLNIEPSRPLSPYQVKKKYEHIEKKVDESKSLFYFSIRKRKDDRLVGFVKIFWIAWTHGSGFVQLGIGAPADRGQGFGDETLQLLLRYAFDELNLFHLTAMLPEYNQVALRLFEKLGFVEEVRRRQAMNRDGRRYDIIQMGLLMDEWKVQEEEPQNIVS
jgi:RimJ/RimL family protein N-acetyltransferase